MDTYPMPVIHILIRIPYITFNNENRVPFFIVSIKLHKNTIK
jgi:hypothetical protein